MKKKTTKWYNIKSLIDANTTFHFLTGARKAGKSYSFLIGARKAGKQKNHS